MRRRRGDGSLARVRERLPVAAVAFVVIALFALAFAPIALLHDLDGMREHTAATTDRAQAIADRLRLLIFEELDYNKGAFLGQPGAVAAYRQLRQRDDAALDTLRMVTDRISPRLARQVDSVRAHMARWHRLPDVYAAGGVTKALFVAGLPGVRAELDSMLSALQGVETSVEVSRTQDEARGSRALRRHDLVSLAVGLLALLATGVLVWFARRDRALSRQLAVALDQEAMARAAAEHRRIELTRVTDSKSRIMLGFSHDVKNPIGAADGYMQLLEDGMMDPLTDRQTATVARARRSVAQALRLIDELLAVARAETGAVDIHLEPVSLNDLARETTEAFRVQAERKGLALVLDNRADDNGTAGVIVQSDPARVRQVLANLVSNAVKYTARGTVSVRVAAEGEGATVEVTDTGAGIPADRQHLLFQEFVRLDPHAASGAGIGLAISQKLARALGGEITVTSEAGRGSRFVLSLPVSAPT